MKTVLILTNPDYIDFILNTAASLSDEYKEFQILIKCFGEFDWSEDYDIGISFMYQHKVPAKEVNSHPWFNFHPAPLPQYRGRDLCYHAIMNGEKEFGATIHYMDENFDTGEIIDVWEFDVPYWWTAEHLSDRAIWASKCLFEDYLPKILKTPVFLTSPNKGGTYYKKGQIIDTVPVDPKSPFGQFVRAVTYKDFYPCIDIGGVKYKIIKE